MTTNYFDFDPYIIPDLLIDLGLSVAYTKTCVISKIIDLKQGKILTAFQKDELQIVLNYCEIKYNRQVSLNLFTYLLKSYSKFFLKCDYLGYHRQSKQGFCFLLGITDGVVSPHNIFTQFENHLVWYERFSRSRFINESNVDMTDTENVDPLLLWVYLKFFRLSSLLKLPKSFDADYISDFINLVQSSELKELQSENLAKYKFLNDCCNIITTNLDEVTPKEVLEYFKSNRYLNSLRYSTTNYLAS